MPTFREDLHLGHKVPYVQTDDIENRGITNEKMADQSVDERVLKDGSVSTQKLQNESVTEEKLSFESVTENKLAPSAVTSEKIGKEEVHNEHIAKKTIAIDRLDEEVQNLIFSAASHGIAVANEFGDNNLISVSQKKLTDAFVKVWQKLEDITGEVLQGFDMQITPEYYIGETGADVHITANTVDTNGIFEHIAVYGNGILIAEADNVDFFEHDFHIDETTVIQCVAKIMGIEYNRQGIITHYSSFLLGSGDTYADLMDDNNRFLPQYVIPITNGMRGAYDVNVAEGKRIIIVVGESLAAGFIRADLNGVEIQFTETTATDADGKVYKVFTSEPWSEGDYNIDING